MGKNIGITELKKIFANNTRSLEILYLLNNLKKAVRLDANENELGKIKDFCDKERLHLEISDFKVIKIKDDGKGGYSNIVKKVPNDYIGGGLYHIYISKDKTISKFLKLLENKKDDEAVGKVLGYPECCIDFFIKYMEKQQKIQNDYILPALENSEGFRFSFHNNYAARYFDATLLSHFPHSFDCPESINIAKKNLECIRQNSPELADEFEEMLKCAVLYTEHEGVFLLKGLELSNKEWSNTKTNNEKLIFNNIKSTIKNDIFSLLNKNKEICIIDKNKIKIENEIIDNVGFMIFE